MIRSIVAVFAAVAALVSIAAAPPADAQTAPETGAAEPQQNLWAVRCTTSSREAPPDCLIEQRAVVTETGRLLMLFTVRVPADTRRPVMMLQAPLGPFLPAGITLDVDGASTLELEYQTCDANGCYAGSPVSDELLQAMFRGQNLNLTVQALNKQPIKVPLDLTGFTAAYRRIQ